MARSAKRGKDTVGVIFGVVRAKYAEMGHMYFGAVHNLLRLLRFPSWWVWKRGRGTRDRAGRLSVGVRYPKYASILFIVFAARRRADLALATISGGHVFAQFRKSVVRREAM